MKAKTAGFYGGSVWPKARQVKQVGARWFLRNSVIFTRLYERSQRKKGWFFAVKAKLARFYVDRVEPKVTVLKAKATQFKGWVTGRWAMARTKAAEVKQQLNNWVTRRQHGLWITAIVVAALVVGAALAYLWYRSPAVRAMVKTVGVAALGVLITLWALLKGLGLNLGEGLRGLGRGLAALGAGVLNILALLWTRFTNPVIEIVVVARPTGDTIPVPPVDGRRGL